ncbi:hypothetical protein BC830DRAFT_699840 [Chytriomyces sp. MP71]|nr:hypothetical protein BC830DRAFT_699840 [Chytriomyces sp. MP71]
MPLTPDQESNVLLVMRCVSPFSMIATLAVILHVTCFNRNRTSLINRFQAYLAVNDFVFCVDFVLGVSIVTNAPLCTIFGFLHEFVDVCGTCLVVCITHLCYKTVERGSKAAAALRWWYFAYSFVTPLLFITLLWIAATILNRGTLMGNATYECWISAAYPELKVAFIYPLLWIHMVVIVIIYTRIYQKTQSSAYELSGIWGSTGYNTTTIASRHERGVDAVLSDNPGLAITVLSGSSTVPPAAKIQTISKSRRPSLTKNDNALSLSLQEHLPPTFPEASLQRKITTKSVKMDTEKQMRRSLNRLILKGSLIAIGFVISWTPATIVRVMQLFNIPVPYWMIVCAGICLAMTGLMNASVYLVMLIVR